MEPYPDNFTSVYATDTETFFEGQTWWYDGIYSRAVVAQNQNEPSFKNVWSPQILSYIDRFLHYIPIKWLIIMLLPSMSRGYEGGTYCSIEIWRSTMLFFQWLLMSTCSGWKRENIWRGWGNSCLNADLTPSVLNLVSLTLPIHPMLITFGKFT